MLWLWILGVIAVLLFLLCITRVGIYAALRSGAMYLDVKIGLFKVHLLPKKEKKQSPRQEARSAAKKAAADAKRAEKEAAKKAKKAAQKEKKEPLSVKTERLKAILSDVESAFNAIWPALKRGLERTRKGLRIDPLQLSVTVGAQKDPASGAQLYGYIHAGVWTFMPVLEQLLDIPNPYIHVGVDFDSADTVPEGECGIHARIGTLLAVAVTVAVPALKWFLQWKKKLNAETTEKG